LSVLRLKEAVGVCSILVWPSSFFKVAPRLGLNQEGSIVLNITLCLRSRIEYRALTALLRSINQDVRIRCQRELGALGEDEARAFIAARQPLEVADSFRGPMLELASSLRSSRRSPTPATDNREVMNQAHKLLSLGVRVLSLLDRLRAFFGGWQ